MKKVLSLYFSSWWIPSFVYLAFLAAFSTTISLPLPRQLAIVANGLFYIPGLAFLGLVSRAN